MKLKIGRRALAAMAIAGSSTLGAVAGAATSGAEDMAKAYARAEELLPWNVYGKLHALDVQPNWIGDTDRFWYQVTSERGSQFVLVDAARNTRNPAFDHARMAKALSAVTGKAYMEWALPFDSFEARDGFNRLRASIENRVVECDLRNYACSELHAPELLQPGEVASPDGNWAAFTREHDLYLRSRADGREIRLTNDGQENDGYGEWADSHMLSLQAKRAGLIRPARVLWAPDSSRLVSYRVDQREVIPSPIVQWVPDEGYGARPRVHWVRVPFPPDEHLPTARLVFFELGMKPGAAVRRVDVAGDPIPMSYDLIYWEGSPWWGQLWWDADGKRLYSVREERGYRKAQVYVTDASSGTSKVLVEETSPTHLMFTYGGLPDAMTASRLHWLSSRDGWQHVYRYDSRTGRLLSQVTHGDWHVDRVVHADAGEGWVYFQAGGREPGLDPYFTQLYRARPDGSGLKRLTPEDASHGINFSPSGRYFVDNYSRPDLAPVSILRRADGREVRVLEKADIRALDACGRQKIERVVAKGRDGKTDIYGTLYLPSNFDASRKYPVLDDIYGGPVGTQAAMTFTPGQAIAELGFIVVQIDGMGIPGRSKAFLDVSYGKGFAEAGGLEDHIAVLRALAQRRPYMDLDRVGIFGYSGGGYSSTRAVLDHPDFFKVAVSGAGSHDQSLYQLEWGERFVGRPEWDPEAWRLQANSRNVSKLRGKLLLAHGDLDDDVPMANTMQLVDALIKANKDFDLLIVPGTDHATLYRSPYFVRRQWDYFVTHLLGVQPPANYAIGGCAGCPPTQAY